MQMRDKIAEVIKSVFSQHLLPTLLSMDLIIFSNYLSIMNNKHDGKKIKNHFSPNKIVGRAFEFLTNVL